MSYLNQGSAGRHIAEAKVIKRGRQINFLACDACGVAGSDGKDASHRADDQ